MKHVRRVRLSHPLRRRETATMMAVAATVTFFVVWPHAVGAQAPGATTAAPPAALTIAAAEEEAVQHNLDLIAKRADLSVADAAIVTARLKPNPVFSFDADHLDWLGTGFNDINNGGPTEISGRVDVPIERGGKRQLRITEATSDRRVAEANVAEAVRQLDEDVALACMDVIQATDNLSLARDTLRSFEDLATLNDNRVRAGAAPPYEAARTHVATEQFRATVSRADLELKAASTRLAQLLGRPPTGDVLEITARPSVPAGAAFDLANLQALAHAHRTDLQAARLTEARTAADLKLQLANGKVDVTWGAEYRRQAGPIGESNSLGLFFSTPLAFSNRNQGEIARAGAEGVAARREIDATTANVDADVRAAFDAYQSTALLVTNIEHDLLDPARSVRDTAEYTYRAGASTLVDLIDSQRAWNDAMQSYYDAQADYGRAVARLNAAIGTEVIP